MNPFKIAPRLTVYLLIAISSTIAACGTKSDGASNAPPNNPANEKTGGSAELPADLPGLQAYYLEASNSVRGNYKKVAEKEAQVSAFQPTYDQALGQLDAAKTAVRKWSNAIESTQQDIANLNSEREDSRNRILNLQSQIDRRLDRMDLVSRRVDQLDREVGQLSREVDSAKRDMAPSQREYNDAVENLRRAENRHRDNQEAIQHLDKNNRHLRDQINDHGQKRAKARGNLDNINSQLPSAEQNLQRSERLRIQADRLADHHQTRVTEIRQALERAKAEKPRDQQKVDNLKRQLDEAENEFRQAHQIRKQKLKEENADRERLAKLQRERRENEEWISRLNNEISASQRQISDNDTEIGRRRNEDSRLRREVEVAESRLRPVREEYQRKRARVDRLQAECDRAAQERDVTLQELNSLRFQQTQDRDQVRRLDARIQSINEEIPRLESDIPDYRQKLAQAEGLKDTAQAEFNPVKTEMDALKLALATATELLNSTLGAREQSLAKILEFPHPVQTKKVFTPEPLIYKWEITNTTTEPLNVQVSAAFDFGLDLIDVKPSVLPLSPGQKVLVWFTLPQRPGSENNLEILVTGESVLVAPPVIFHFKKKP